MSAVPKRPAQNTTDYDHQLRDFPLSISNDESSASAPSREIGPPLAVTAQEPYVDAQCVAEHLSLTRREVLKLTRARKLPAHAIDPSAVRKIYRYKLSEIEGVLSQTLMTKEALGFSIPSRDNGLRQPRDRRGKINGQREW